jgi:hypothetical protein
MSISQGWEIALDFAIGRELGWTVVCTICSFCHFHFIASNNQATPLLGSIHCQID